MTGALPPAPCLGATAVMFPSEPDDTDAYEAARAVCSVCPAPTFRACLTAGWREPFGVWGGLSELDRRKARSRKLRPEDFFRFDESEAP